MPNVRFALVLLAACSVQLAAQSLPEAAAEQADNEWLRSIDRADYGDAFGHAAKAMQSGSEADFARAIAQTRAALGPLESRKLRSAKQTTTLPGSPDGHYVITQYESAFAHKRSAVETVIAVQEPDRNWRVTGYFIK